MKNLPSYIYPDNIVTSGKIGKLVNINIGVRIKKESAVKISVLDAQKPIYKRMYGSGFLVSDATAEELKEKASKIGGLKVEELKAERLKEEKMKKAIRFELSETEREIVEKLNENERRHREDTEAENQGGGEVGA